MEKELTSAMAWNLLDDLDDGVIVADINGIVLYKNRAALSLSGLEDEASSLARIETYFAPEAECGDLLNPPKDMNLPSVNGRTLLAHSKSILLDGDSLIQIRLTPDQAKPAKIQDPPTTALDQLATLTDINRAEDFNQKLQRLVDGLQETGWNRVGLTLRDENFNPTQMITAGFTDEELAYFREHMLPADFWLTLFNDKSLQRFRHGNCYFVPGTSAWSQENLQNILPDPQA
ncbi:MAG TPA: PAS domain-containing protein, partial [Anaerolineae bacterium]|nr:PAS domain-containing protein [Anaerolineae bacterium]